MAEYSQLLFGDTWKDLGIVKIEEDDPEDDDDISKPEDLSIKTRSISIQTDDCMQAMLGSYFPHLSMQQLGTFLEVLSNILAKRTEEQSTPSQTPTSTREESSKSSAKSGWISLEPDFVTHAKEDFDDTNQSGEDKTKPTEIDIEYIKTEPHYSDVEPEDSDSLNSNNSSLITRHQTFQKPAAESAFQTPETLEKDVASEFPKSSQTFQTEQEGREGLAKMRTVTAFVPYRIKRVAPVESSHSAARSPLTRDERMVNNLKIPFSVDFIINSSTEQFNEFNINLNEEQRNLCRDIRRRGKNKIAAQNCRKRKVEQISCLEEELEVFTRRKDVLRKENAELGEIHRAWISRIASLENIILDSGIENIPQWLHSKT